MGKGCYWLPQRKIPEQQRTVRQIEIERQKTKQQPLTMTKRDRWLLRSSALRWTRQRRMIRRQTM